LAGRRGVNLENGGVEPLKKPKAVSKRKTNDARALACRIADLVEGKGATDIVILNVSGASALADYFVICSADSSPQVGAIIDAVDANLSKAGIVPLGVEGKKDNVWVLADYNDVILNIFRTEARAFYHLEQLWGDAPVVPRRPKAAAAQRHRKTTATTSTGPNLTGVPCRSSS